MSWLRVLAQPFNIYYHSRILICCIYFKGDSSFRPFLNLLFPGYVLAEFLVAENYISIDDFFEYFQLSKAVLIQLAQDQSSFNLVTLRRFYQMRRFYQRAATVSNFLLNVNPQFLVVKRLTDGRMTFNSVEPLQGLVSKLICIGIQVPMFPFSKLFYVFSIVHACCLLCKRVQKPEEHRRVT